MNTVLFAAVQQRHSHVQNLDGSFQGVLFERLPRLNTCDEQIGWLDISVYHSALVGVL